MLKIMWTIVIILIFMAGASVFSFLNVVIYRVPRNLSFVSGRSICPSCGKTLRGCDMIPVLNWIYLKGKCHYCKGAISPRYPLIELLGGITALACVWKYGYNLQGIIAFAFLSMLTVVAFVDQDTMEIPNGFVIGIFIIALISVFFFKEPGIIERLIGMVSISVPLLLITLVIAGAFGGGDMKLMAAAGFYLGWKMSLLAFFCAVFVGGGYGIYLLATRKKGKKDHFAFGPFLCIGMAIALLAGENLLNWYLGLFL